MFKINTIMTLFLLFILLITLIIIWLVIGNGKEYFNNRKLCCGNIDWYLGEKLYKELCGKETCGKKSKIKENFENQEEEECDNNPIKFQNKYTEDSDEDLETFCKSKGYKASFSPRICSEGEGLDRVYDFYRNCKCVDEKNNCKICYKKPDWPGLT